MRDLDRYLFYSAPAIQYPSCYLNKRTFMTQSNSLKTRTFSLQYILDYCGEQPRSRKCNSLSRGQSLSEVKC